MDKPMTDYQRGMLEAARICEAQMAWVLKPGWGESVSDEARNDHFANLCCARAIRRVANLPPEVK